MTIFRLLYRNILVECLLFLTLSIQIVSGFTMFFSKTKNTNTLIDKIQIWSGLYLGVFLLIHVSAILIGRYVFLLDTNFHFGAVGLNYFPFNIFFIPYYGLAIIGFFCHIAAAIHKKSKKYFLSITFTGILTAICVLMGFTNNFNGINIPDEYYNLIKNLLPF